MDSVYRDLLSMSQLEELKGLRQRHLKKVLKEVTFIEVVQRYFDLDKGKDESIESSIESMFAGKKLDNKTISALSGFVKKHSNTSKKNTKSIKTEESKDSIIEKIESKDYSQDQKLKLSIKYLDNIQNRIDTTEEEWQDSAKRFIDDSREIINKLIEAIALKEESENES